ncbi:MAG: hypothetical protein M0P32_06830 [Bacteroidales bacterium]|nr:hypothetical protein [Bacteroidales bacterium]MDD2636867.1 hypothetical protein [Bacteroidales bacterium]MDY0144017.1 hypothetical protein [Bacteroidales bacterium]
MSYNKLFYSFLFLFCVNYYVSSQDRSHYCFPILDSLVELEQYREAIKELKSRDSLSNDDLYSLAVCYSKTGNYQISQSYLVDFINKMPYSFSPQIFLDYRIEDLRKSDKWNYVYDKLIGKFLMESGQIKDTTLAISLFLHGIKDQKYRGLIHSQPIMKGGEFAGKVMTTENVDSINTVFLDSVVNKIGWPTYSMVGKISGNYAFYIMQHSDKKHLKRYVPLMEKAVLKYEADKFLWAMAYDRLRRYCNKKQIYGTQYFSKIIDGKMQPNELQPTKNRKNINQIRKDFGFTTTVEEEIVKYNKMYGIK